MTTTSAIATCFGSGCLVHMNERNENFEPELRLLIACSHARLNETQSRLVLDLLDGKVDWDRLLEWAMRHHLTPLLFKTLSEHALDRLPTRVFAVLKMAHEKNRKQSCSHFTEMVRIDKALRRSGITAIPFKGPTLAQFLNSNANERVSTDLDFFVPVLDSDNTLEVLASLGYGIEPPTSWTQERLIRRYSGQYQLVHRDSGVIVEPHWAIGHRVFSFNIEHDGLWARSQSLNIGGYTFSFLSAHDLIILLCVHGSKEHWIRLKWVCDVAAFLIGNPDLDWSVALKRATGWGCHRMLLLGVLLAKDLLGAPVPAILQAEISADRILPILLNSVYLGITDLERSTPDIWRVNAFRRQMRERRIDQLSYMLRTTFTPKSHHLKMLALPYRLRWGYCAVRCAHDYLGLPLWKLGKSITAATNRR